MLAIYGCEPKTEQIMEMMAEYNKLPKKTACSTGAGLETGLPPSFTVNKDRWASSSTLYKTQIT